MTDLRRRFMDDMTLHGTEAGANENRPNQSNDGAKRPGRLPRNKSHYAPSRKSFDSRRIRMGDLADLTAWPRFRGNVWSFRHTEPRLCAPR